MSGSQKAKELDFGGMATYRIVVQGLLNEEWADRFAGLAITPAPGDNEPSRTTLRGSVQDHTELYGVLDALYDLHLPLLLVEWVAHQQEQRTTPLKEMTP